MPFILKTLAVMFWRLLNNDLGIRRRVTIFALAVNTSKETTKYG